MIRAILSLGCTAVPLLAQVATERQSQGPLMGVSQAFSTAPGTVGTAGPVDATRLLFRPDGFLGATPGEYAAQPLPGIPDYSTDVLLQHTMPRPDIDAFSVGLDWVVSDATGLAVVPPGHWAALSFSVTRATVGAPPGMAPSSVVFTEAGGPDGAAGDLFSFVLPGSVAPPEIIGVTQRAQDATELALAALAGPADVDAHDVFVGLLWERNPDLAYLLPPALRTPRAFFSVSPATVGRVPASWWAGTVPSAATIFCTSWIAGGWTVPTPFILPSQLGLGSGEDVDAVAVDLTRDRLLFSTATAGRDPILFASGFDTSCAPASRPTLFVAPYRTPAPSDAPDDPPVSVVIGLITADDVDAICALDPGGDPLLQLLIGAPDPSAGIPTLQPYLAASSFRSFDGVSQTVEYRSHMAGWPPTGRQPNVLGGVLVGILQPVNWQPLAFVGGPFRHLSSPFGGAPELLSIVVPQLPSTLGLPIWLWWGAADPQTGSFGIARPVRVRL
ncbi:MAG: hypothetical protein IPM29_21345 [Planctomycetes bacterium]|nr:hypothetical protein [Planctomycetota bacterium]